MTALAAAQRTHSNAALALEDARDRYQAAGWSHLQAPTERTVRTLTTAAAHFLAAREVLCAAEVRLSDAETARQLDAEIAAFAVPLRRAA